MSHRTAWIVVLSMVLGTGAALAQPENRITQARAELNDQAFVVHVEAEAALGEPRVRTEPGVVRVWIPSVASDAIDAAGDGTAVQTVRLRPGYGETTLALVQLADRRTVDREAISFHRAENHLEIRIARSALRTTPTPTAATPSPSPSDEDLEAAAAEPPPPADEPEVTGEPEPAPIPRRAEAMPLPAGSAMPSLGVLALVALLLGGAYVGLRLFTRRKKDDAPHRRIDIVASKRIGARHQLIVVRALGQDHLLSVHNGRTQKLGAVPTPAGDEAGAQQSGEDAGFLPFLRLRDQADPDSSQMHRKTEERPRFGAELLKLTSPGPLPDASHSEAVAGLLRLRERAGRAQAG